LLNGLEDLGYVSRSRDPMTAADIGLLEALRALA
jgi:hypothetical protein